MSVTTLNLEIYQGDTFIKEIIISDENGNAIDLTTGNYAFFSQIRRSTDSDVVLVDFDTYIIDATTGSVAIALSAEETLLLPVPSTNWVWDLKSMHEDAYWDTTEPTSEIWKTYFSGKVTVVKDVTRV